MRPRVEPPLAERSGVHAGQDVAGHALGSEPQAPGPAQWRSLLAESRPARSWNELATARAPLLSALAAPQARAIGESLAALQQQLMSPEVTQQRFARKSHGVDYLIQSSASLPDQAVVIAYADLQVQQATAARRWPRAEPDPPTPDWAARPA